MCGISGIIGNIDVYEYLIMALSMLMNRGYDSMGICTLSQGSKPMQDLQNLNTLNIKNDEKNINSTGEMTNCDFVIDKYASRENIMAIELLKEKKSNHQNRNIGICHARWSTHGEKTDTNAHPHTDYYNLFSLVHNGIIENYAELKDKLISNGYFFKSETDTEVIVNLISYYYNLNKNVEEAIKKALYDIEGTYALAILYKNDPDTLYCVRKGSPLLVSINEKFGFIASERSGFGGKVNSYFALDNNDLCVIKRINGKIKFSTSKSYNNKVLENIEDITSPSPYQHWTLKEIMEQNDSVLRSICNGGRFKNESEVKLGGLEDNKNQLLEIQNIILLGCGTSYHSALVGSEYFKDLCNFNTVQVFDAGSFSLKDIPKNGNTGIIYISQSGETKDLHRCLEMVSDLDIINIGVINVVDSLIAREVDCGVYLNAGREVAVASTKAFTSQVVVLSLVAIWFAQNFKINEKKRIQYIKSLNRLHYDIQNILDSSLSLDTIKNIAEYLTNQNSMFILGKGMMEPVAKEGSLKIKEIGYIHAEGYSSSALKHGPYSLLQQNTPVILITPNDEHFVRNQGIMEEIKSRKSFIIAITDSPVSKKYDMIIQIPHNKHYQNILSNIPMQLIAYYLALEKGHNPDFPRNLAKVVTVD